MKNMKKICGHLLYKGDRIQHNFFMKIHENVFEKTRSSSFYVDTIVLLEWETLKKANFTLENDIFRYIGPFAHDHVDYLQPPCPIQCHLPQKMSLPP